MATKETLEATARADTGKGAARALRRDGKLPAVVYGHHREAQSLTLDAKAVERLLAAIGSGATMIDLAVDDQEPVKALIREVQRDPLRPTSVIHLDLYEVQAGEKITVDVPIHIIGIPSGVRNFAGVLDHLLHKLEIEVLPADLPDHIDVDVTELEIGSVIFVRELSVPNAEILSDGDRVVCTVVPPRVEEVAVVAEVEGVVGDEAAAAEPELIRKPKAEEEDED
jgi:large subunit ribosomal protein L25